MNSHDASPTKCDLLSPTCLLSKLEQEAGTTMLCAPRGFSENIQAVGVELMGIYGMETPCCGLFQATQLWVHLSKKSEKQVYHICAIH